MQQRYSGVLLALVAALALITGGVLLMQMRSDGQSPSAIQLTDPAQINAPPATLSVPELISPPDFEVTTNLRPTLTWGSVEGAAYYEVQVWLGSLFWETETTTETSFTPAGDLVGTGYVSWYVRAYDADGRHTAWSASRRIGLASLPDDVPRLYRTASSPTLAWQSVTWATAYHLQIDNNGDFSSPLFEDMTIPADQQSFRPPLSPPQAGHYYWRVRAQRDDGTWGEWSMISTFTKSAPKAPRFVYGDVGRKDY